MSKKSTKLMALSMSLLLSASAVLVNVEKANAAEVSVPNKIDSNIDIARTIAEEGMVLLKNEGMLPLKQSDAVVGFGSAQDTEIVYGGSGAGWVNATNKINYADGLRAAATADDIESYTKLETVGGVSADKALYFISRSSSEHADNALSTYYLTDQEKSDIQALIAYYGASNVGVILNVGNVIDTTWLISQNVGAIVVTYYAGEQAGIALANLLVGKSNFSGKTVDTWAKDYNDYPSSSIGTFAGDANTYYTEDIYVGYRYFETFDPDYKKVNYEFGYGLSYTEFEFTDKTININGDYATIDVTVKNVGDCAGKEVVQAYYSAPQGNFGNPARELAGFAKTELLQPGESDIVSIDFNLNDMAVYDDTGIICNNSWVMLKGDYTFYIGNSVKDAALNGEMPKKYTLSEDKVLETTCELLPTQLPERLLSNGTYQILDGETSLSHTINPYGANTIQAEAYSDKSSMPKTEIFYIGEHASCGVGNLNNSVGEWLEYTLDVKEAGTYKIAFSMSSPWENQNDMFRVSVNGEARPVQINMGQTTVNPSATKDWYKCGFVADDNYTIDLPEGKVTLRFTGNAQRFQNIDYFMIYKDTVSGENETVIEAETSVNSSVGVVQIANGMATAVSEMSGNTYTYNLDVERAGQYGVSLLASNVSFASRNSVKITVNGADVTNKIALKRTAGGSDTFESNFYTFTKTDSVMVDLIAGTNTITFTTLDDSLACIEKLYICPAGADEIVSGNYQDNTDEFNYDNDLSGAELEEFISFNDVVTDSTKLDEFISQMSIEELAKLLAVEPNNNDAQTGTGGVGGWLLSDEYQIPDANTSDGPAGIRYTNASLYSTWFPCMTLLASTWNVEIAQVFGKAVASEAKKGNVQVWLAPGVNIHRNPLCGRNFEYYSEDPLISAMMGKYATIGAQSLGVSVCVKHFAVNNQETNRYNNNSCVSNRALREIYFKSFEIIVKEAKPYAVMSSYNRLNGEYVAATYEVITDLLYNEWGFEGAVFGDWQATISHVDYVQAGGTFKSFVPQYDMLIEAYKSGVLSRDQLEYCAKDVIRFLILSDAVVQNQTVIDAENVYLDVNKAKSWEYTNDGITTYLYRIYAMQDCRYTVKVCGGDGYKFFFDDREIALENGEAIIDFTFGQHNMIIRDSAGEIVDLEEIQIIPYIGKISENDASPDDTQTDSTTPDNSIDNGAPDDTGEDNGSAIGKVLGVSLGGLAVVVLAVLGIWFVKKRAKNK